MRWAEIAIEIPAESVEPISAALTETGCAGVVVYDPDAVSSDPFADWVHTDDPTPTQIQCLCRVVGYLPVDDRLEQSLDNLRDRLALVREAGMESGSGITLRTVDDESWAEAWKAYFKPLRVGKRFVVKLGWETWSAEPEDLVIELDPGMAFGSGSHPSTQLCLKALEELVEAGDTALDWGTGSGILAVGIGLLGARSVLAIDLDPLAVQVAGENIDRNGFSGRIVCRQGSIEQLEPAPTFNIVVANIIADPIIAGAREIAARTLPNGRILVSGIIDRREVEVRQSLEAAGLQHHFTLSDQEWRALAFTRIESEVVNG